jgi:hypothetical protein
MYDLYLFIHFTHKCATFDGRQLFMMIYVNANKKLMFQKIYTFQTSPSSSSSQHRLFCLSNEHDIYIYVCKRREWRNWFAVMKKRWTRAITKRSTRNDSHKKLVTSDLHYFIVHSQSDVMGCFNFFLSIFTWCSFSHINVHTYYTFMFQFTRAHFSSFMLQNNSHEYFFSHFSVLPFAYILLQLKCK